MYVDYGNLLQTYKLKPTFRINTKAAYTILIAFVFIPRSNKQN